MGDRIWFLYWKHTLYISEVSLPRANQKAFASLDFRDRVAVITGGASGIGLSVASQLFELGAKVVIADID